MPTPIKSDFGERTINELMLMFRNRQINLEPGFQRKSVWSDLDRKRLIQSIVSNYPVPCIFLYKREHKGRLVYDVIDGKQRLETIFMFLRLGRFKSRAFGVKLDLGDGLDSYDWRDVHRYHHDTHSALFQGAPQFYDVVLMNPPFGGKEGKEAQTPYEYKTGATQVLFLQNVLKSMRKNSHCGIVLDEGVLFRVDAEAFVKTKRKLLEECNVYCIVSLPGGVFTSAGAGVKTNLVFFIKGQPTEKIWYYDLSDVKVGKKTPITLRNFDDFFPLLPKRADSPRSWTVDFATRLQTALDEARPHREKVTQLLAQAKVLEDEFRENRKAKRLAAM